MSTTRLVFGVTFLVVTLGCGGAARDIEHVGSTTAALTGGVSAVPGQGEYVVSLGECSGVLLSRFAILTAAHCLPSGEDDVVLPVRLGPSLRCVGSSKADSACPGIALRAHRHSDADIALLTSERALVDESSRSPASPSAARSVWGVGDGSYVDDAGNVAGVAHGKRVLYSRLQIDQLMHAGFEAKAGASAVCDGDSGGPATIDREGRTLVAGVLSVSEVSEASPRCTKSGGLQLWARVGAFLPFFERVLGTCSRRSLGGQQGAWCTGRPLKNVTLPSGAESALEYLVHC